MNNDMELRLKITADGKVAVSVAGQVENSVSDIGKSAQQASKSVSAMMAALSKSPNFDAKKLDGAKLAYGMNEAARAASAYKLQQAEANAKAIEGARVYNDLVSKLTMTTSAYRAQELALQGLSAQQIKHIQTLEASAAKTSSTMQNIVRMTAGFASVGAAFAMGKDILDTNRNMEMLRAQLTSLTGSAQASAAAFQFVSEFAANTPFEIKGLTESFIALKNFGINPTREVMQAITNQASKLGGSQETLTSITMQLGQAYSKGKLQQEDMMILAERGVPIYNLLAQVTGKNTAQLMDMSEKGLLTRDVIEQLIRKMGEMAKGGNANAMDTLNGKISNLSDAWHSFEDALMQDKSEGFIKWIVTGWTDYLNDFTAQLNTIPDAIATIDEKIAKIKKVEKFNRLRPEQQQALDELTRQRETALANKHAATPLGGSLAAEMDSLLADAKRQAENYSLVNQGIADATERLWEKNRKTIEDNERKSQQASQQAANKAKQEALAVEKRLQDLRDMARSTDQVFIDIVKEYTAAYNQGNIVLTEYVALLAKADDARDKSIQKANPTVQAIPHFYQGGMNQAAYSAADQAVNYEMDSAWKSESKSVEALKAYNEKLDGAKDKTSDLAAVTTAVFDGALGGVNALAGAFDNMVNSINKNSVELDQLHEKIRLNNTLDDSDFKKSNAAKYAAEELKLNDKVTQAKLKGVSQVAGFLSNSLKKGSTEQRAAHAIQMGLAGAELAMNFMKIAGIGAVAAAETASVGPSVAASTAKGTAKAAEAVATQAGAGPYVGFALMAAMAAAMAAIGFGVGGSGGKGAVSLVGTAAMPLSPTIGTVLGDPTAKSESINNTYELLKDIHAKEYRELRGINSGVAALKTGITDSITRLFQAGGLQVPAGLEWSKSNVPQLNKLPADPVAKWAATGDPIMKFIMGGLFGKTTAKVTGGGIYAGGTSLAELLAGGQLNAQQYTEITTTKKSWFSKKTTASEMLSALDHDFQTTLSKMFQGMGTSMMAMATEFGADMTNTVNNYVIPSLKVSLHGMSSDDMIKTLNNVLSTQLDTMTTQIFGSLIAKYQKLGEGLFETATRLVAEKAVVLDAIDMVGSSFKGDAVEMADGLITLAGGIKEFQGLFQDYYSKFYTEAEQLANTTRRLVANLGDFGLMLPDTRSAYRDLVNAQQLDTAAGRERYNQLLSLAEAADTYYQANEKLRESMELLSKDTFATAVDYTRYLSLASLAGITKATELLPPNPNSTFMPTGNSGQLFPGIPGNSVASAMTTVAESNNAVVNEVKRVADEVRQLRIEQQAQGIAIAQNTADVSRIMKRWEGGGLPETRVLN